MTALFILLMMILFAGICLALAVLTFSLMRDIEQLRHEVYILTVCRIQKPGEVAIERKNEEFNENQTDTIS